MSLVIPDFRLISAIMATDNPKRSYRWPAGIRADGTLCHPKMSLNSVQQVYEEAPHGKYGNSLAPPYVNVRIVWIEHSCPHEWTDEEMLMEGFDSLHSFGEWWDTFRAGSKNCKTWTEMQNVPFWVCGFVPVSVTTYYKRRAHQYAKEIGLI